MQSSVTKILNILGEETTFFSNGFSSGYSYTAEQAENYLRDLLSNSETAPIFSGIIILQKQVQKYNIVDGLQRLTTLFILFAAICDILKKASEKEKKLEDEIRSKYLLNKESLPKLRLPEPDGTTFNKIILEKTLDENDTDSPIYETYSTFMKYLTNKKEDVSLIIKLISQVQYMVIITKETEIATRDLYQSLNFVNQESQINLITDFIAQQGAPAKKLWKSIVDLFNLTPNKLESFLKDFITARLDENVINKEAVYNNFKKYFYKISKYQKPREIVETIHKYAIYYLKIANSDFKNEKIKHQINILNQNSGRDAYPYLMEVLDDFENGHINESAFLNLLMMINLFIESRDDYTIGNISIDFSKLSKELNKMLVLKDYVPDIISENKLTINEINNLSNFEV